MPSSEAECTLYDVLHKIWEALLDALTWLSDQCLALLDWLSQVHEARTPTCHDLGTHSCRVLSLLLRTRAPTWLW